MVEGRWYTWGKAGQDSNPVTSKEATSWWLGIHYSTRQGTYVLACLEYVLSLYSSLDDACD